MLDTFHVTDAIGVLGSLVLVSTYFAIQSGIIDGKSLRSAVLNGIGSSLILSSLFFSFNLASFLIEFFWLLISIFGIVMNLGIARRKS